MYWAVVIFSCPNADTAIHKNPTMATSRLFIMQNWFTIEFTREYKPTTYKRKSVKIVSLRGEADIKKKTE